MLRIVLGSYMVRYPLGGMMSWVLQYLLGFDRLGHEIWLVEKAGYPNSCYDPERDVMTDDCTYGVAAVNRVLSRFGLADRWCFVDASGRYHGTDRSMTEDVLATADVFLDMGTHGAWLEEAAGAGIRVLIDGEPGFTQMKMVDAARQGNPPAGYDRYYTTGSNIGTERSTAPDAGVDWGHLVHPVVCDLFADIDRPGSGPYTTVMNWRSYEPLDFEGETYGHKDAEFQQFLTLPSRVDVPLEIAVDSQAPGDDLREQGWQVEDAHSVTRTLDSFYDYVASSRGEFSVCKSGYVRTRCGWFSDRGAVYLASGRPVIQQETGFSDVLPTGRGLFAVSSLDGAAAALSEVDGDLTRHSEAAREVARAYLDTDVVLSRFLHELDL